MNFDDAFEFAVERLCGMELNRFALYCVAMDFAAMDSTEDHESLAHAWMEFCRRIGAGNLASYSLVQRTRFLRFAAISHMEERMRSRK
jgi:hypothetical protein